MGGDSPDLFARNDVNGKMSKQNVKPLRCWIVGIILLLAGATTWNIQLTKPGLQNELGWLLIISGIFLVLIAIFSKQIDSFDLKLQRFRLRLLFEKSPEIGLFDSDDDRYEAIQRAFRAVEENRRKQVPLWRRTMQVVLVGVTLGAVFTILIPQVAITLSAILPADFATGGAIILTVFAPLIAYFFWYYRKRIPRQLRQQLVDASVPICVNCGYDLRGASQAQCPECGCELDHRIVEIIGSSKRNESAQSVLRPPGGPGPLDVWP